MDNIFYRLLLNDKVKIEPKYISKDFRKHIHTKLKANAEGVCTRHGFIKQNSIELYKITPGNVELIGLNGSVVYDVYYYADVCNPLVGNTIKAHVTNVNKFGILAEVADILEIIIAKNSVNIVHDKNINLEDIKIGDLIDIEILGKKYELNDKKISLIGKIITSNTKFAAAKKTKGDALVYGSDDEGEDDLDIVSDEEEEDREDREDKEEDDDENEDKAESVLEDDDPLFEFKGGDNNFFESESEGSVGGSDDEFFDSDLEENGDVSEEEENEF
jgi:DNA-directed RNA polymerase subunit E'/Rpb7